MNRLQHKQANKVIRKNRVRSTVIGDANRPRLSVFISNKHVSAQIIDDSKGVTLVSSTTVHNKKADGSKSELCKLVGEDIAKKASKAKITTVVFDRNGRAYQGRLRAFADTARENGLEF